MEQLECNKKEAHGFLPFSEKYNNIGNEWEMPHTIAISNQQARPGYNSCSAHEYNDVPEVLKEKIKLLAQLIKASNRFVVYSGAGISTAAGIGDYASRAENSAAFTGTERPKVWSEFDAQPTMAHRVITCLYNEGYLKYWIQQNHDGLPQKAGLPQEAINEIHGAWYDPSNPVVQMSGALREDFFSDLIKWEESADLCLAVGTSLAGMNADRVAQSTAERAIGNEDGALGTVIISLQCTKFDSLASLRLFCTIDKAMEMLANELNIIVPEHKLYSLDISPEIQIEEDVFLLTHYGPDGNKLQEPSSLENAMRLDLREDAEIEITIGQFKGHQGVVTGKNRENHYRIRVMHPLKGTFKAPKVHTLGLWWIDAAIRGTVNTIPLVNHSESLVFGNK